MNDSDPPYATTFQSFSIIRQNLDYWEAHEKTPAYRDALRRLIQGNVAVELGAGETPQIDLLQYEPRRYVCVEASNRRPNSSDLPDSMQFVSGMDSVSYLSRRPDNSLVVLSSGLFDHKILMDESYRALLVRLIFRKTKEHGLSLHTICDGLERLFIEVGFKFHFGTNFGEKLTEKQIAGGYTAEGLHGMVPLFFIKGSN